MGRKIPLRAALVHRLGAVTAHTSPGNLGRRDEPNASVHHGPGMQSKSLATFTLGFWATYPFRLSAAHACICFTPPYRFVLRNPLSQFVLRLLHDTPRGDTAKSIRHELPGRKAVLRGQNGERERGSVNFAALAFVREITIESGSPTVRQYIRTLANHESQILMKVRIYSPGLDSK
ncbi:hypothetical protein GQ53DRAFT_184563 [Thozetella sp. PMI_491]|nr:hypothetical protein GQ53DRAFT_184563 [Thozetella sp. PMI_491]